MNVRKEIYKTLSPVINGITAIEWVDLWKAQMNRPKEHYPFGFPAVFIGINNISYQDMTLGTKEGRAQIDLYVFFDKYGDTFAGADDQDNSLLILDTLDEIVQTVEDTEGGLFTGLKLSGDEDVSTRYNRPAYILKFECLIYNPVKADEYVS